MKPLSSRERRGLIWFAGIALLVVPASILSLTMQKEEKVDARPLYQRMLDERREADAAFAADSTSVSESYDTVSGRRSYHSRSQKASAKKKKRAKTKSTRKEPAKRPAPREPFAPIPTTP